LFTTLTRVPCKTKRREQRKVPNKVLFIAFLFDNSTPPFLQPKNDAAADAGGAALLTHFFYPPKISYVRYNFSDTYFKF